MGLTASALILMTACKDKDSLSYRIENDSRLEVVEALGKELAQQGFNAGSSYNEVWIRDFNTFIELSMEVMPDSLIRKNLNMFFAFQGEDGNIVDGFVEKDNANVGYNYRLSDAASNYMSHKNTVETDQESSLVQAVAKYVRKSGNRDYLQEKVLGDETVYQHLARSMEYLIQQKMDSTYGLLTGATTSDWGDIQPEHGWGVEIDGNTHYCIDIYDNAMFVLALNDMAEMAGNDAERTRWQTLRDEVRRRVRQYLWDDEQQKFRPHLYLNGSPFPEDFDESRIFYQGGTAVAILAGILEDDEIDASLQHMLDCQQGANAQTIGITVYPPYPDGFFMNGGMYPYGYQNGGDWTWFGARMVHALLKYGKVEQAYSILSPMLDRVVANQAFYEWYAPSGEPHGSGTFRGEAGVLFTAIEMLKEAVK